MLDWLLEKMAEAAGKTAIANGPAVCTYRELLARVADWQQKLAERGKKHRDGLGAVLGFDADDFPGDAALGQRPSRCFLPRPTPATSWCRFQPRRRRTATTSSRSLRSSSGFGLT